MIDLYKKILTQLQTVSALKEIDLDKGQLELFEMRPPISFPCALVGIQFTRCEDRDIKSKKQEVQALVTIRLAIDFTGLTGSHTPEAKRNTALAYFDLVQAVHAALQGFKDTNINALSRQSLREERRPDLIKVVSIPYTTSFYDDL